MRWDAIVVGAGPSGLAAIRKLKEAGLSVLALEKRHDIGGVWLYEEEPEGHSSAYHTLTTITSKSRSSFEGFPFPKEWPDYLPHFLVQQYFRRYAEHFNLLEHIRFHTAVEKAAVEPNGWEIVAADGSIYHSRYLIAASGHHWKPYLPTYPGTFTGESYHAHAYKHPLQLSDRRVLIVGLGNSGADIAVDAVRVAASVDISIRRGYHILPKFAFWGIPTDEFYHRTVASLPAPLRRFFSSLALQLLLGPMKRYGMPEPKEPLFYTHPLVNSELLYHLRHGKIHLRPAIEQLEGRLVRFTDGTAKEYDTIIWATGYEVDFPYLPAELIPTPEKVSRLYLHIFHLDQPRLLYLGLIQPNGCLWNLSEKQAALVARYIAGVYTLPSTAEAETQTYWRKHAQRFADSPRHLWEVDWHDYAKTLDRLIARHPLPKSKEAALTHA